MYLPSIAPLPAPGPPPPGVARTSFPSLGTYQWLWTVRRGLALPVRSGDTGCRDHDGSEPRSGRIPSSWPEPGPAGSGFRLRDIGRVGVGIEGTKLVQRERLVPAFLELPGQVERLTSVLPGLLVASRQTTDLAEPGEPIGMTSQRACADTSTDPFLQQRVTLHEAPLERRGIAQACRDPRNQFRSPEARQRARPGSNTRTARSSPLG